MNIDTLISDLPDTLASAAEMKDIVFSLPKFRISSREHKNSSLLVYKSELEDVFSYYGEEIAVFDNIFVLGLEENSVFGSVSCRPAADLKDENLHVFFRPQLRPIDTLYGEITFFLTQKGRYFFTVEEYSLSKFYHKPKVTLSDEESERFISVYNRLKNGFGRYSYLAHGMMRFTQDPGYIPMADFPQYWHPLVSAEKNDIVCEGGPEFGDTTFSFAKVAGNGGKVYAFEPDLKNLKISEEFCKECSNVLFVPKGLYSFSGTCYVNTKFFNKVVRERISEEDFECQVVSIDEYFAQKKAPDFIKLDVEGAELGTLEGAKKTINGFVPKLCVAIYHKQTDFLDVPFHLLAYSDKYDFYVAHHTPWYAETFLYAKGKGRD